MIVSTSICANYLPKAMVLAKSLKTSNPAVKFIVCLLETSVDDTVNRFPFFDGIILAKDMGFENFENFIFKHSIVEGSTSVKGQIFLHLLDAFPDETKFVYLDPDIYVYDELTELDTVLETNDIILTPHLCHPEDTIEAVKNNELTALKHGVYNLGFLAIKRSEEGLKFIKWWASRLSMFCYNDIPRGIFTDQKWIDLAPCFFNVYLLKHPGYNAAPWNISKRKISSNNGRYLVNNEPLRFFHFSGFDSGSNIRMLDKYTTDRMETVHEMRDHYLQSLVEMGQNTLGKTPWSYNYYSSGRKIKRSSRIHFRDNPVLQRRYQNPFRESDCKMRYSLFIVFKKTIQKMIKVFNN